MTEQRLRSARISAEQIRKDFQKYLMQLRQATDRLELLKEDVLRLEKKITSALMEMEKEEK